MDEKILKSYAELIVKVGVNLKKGQHAVIRADLDQPQFVKQLVETAYECGADKVEVEWNYQPLDKIHINNRSYKTLERVEDWEVKKLEHRRDKLPCMIYLLSEDPDGMTGVDREKFAANRRARYQKFKKLQDEMENKYQWCIAAVPGAAWAKKMFPELSAREAEEKLWQAILYTSRSLDNPIENWNKHNADLKDKCDKLNAMNLVTLEYSASNGTKLTVGLMPQARWLGGGEQTLSGNFFNPNIPSEEVFITPKRGEAEGIVYSSRPLCYRGELIENFSIEFKNGRAVECRAEKNGQLLKTLIDMDEGSHYLGECALVPYNSPIRESGLLFYNTLFDENAACHLALGEGFSNCIKDYDKYTLEQCRRMGVNESMVHEDFMIGTEDMCIVGVTESGERIKIFENGNWAI